MPRKTLPKLNMIATPATEETTPGTVADTAPLFFVVVVVVFEVAAAVVAALVTVTTELAGAADGVATEAGVVTAATEAAPLISCSIVLLNVPVMPVKVNLAEKAVKGN